MVYDLIHGAKEQADGRNRSLTGRYQRLQCRDNHPDCRMDSPTTLRLVWTSDEAVEPDQRLTTNLA